MEFKITYIRGQYYIELLTLAGTVILRMDKWEHTNTLIGYLKLAVEVEEVAEHLEENE